MLRVGLVTLISPSHFVFGHFGLSVFVSSLAQSNRGKRKKGKAFFIAVLLVEVTAASVSSIKHSSSFCFSVYFPSP
jgi:hypothetical protein